jgi:hypothetical protein
MRNKRIRAITVRGVPAEVERVIRKKTSETGESVNRVVLRLLEQGAGVRKERKKSVHHDLDALFGAWNREEARSFDRALREQREIDPDLWK